MSTLLSQDEVDALLSGVGLSKSTSEPTIDSLTGRPNINLYDFKHPNRVSKDQLRSLKNIHDSFAKILATYLTTTLRMMIDVRLSSIDQVTFREFTMAMSEFDCIWVFEFKNREGRGIIEFSPPLVFMIIDKLFGGMGKPYDDARPTTVIERNVVKRIVDRTLQLWDQSWEKVHEIQSSLVSFETNPQLAQIAPLSESVIVIYLEVALRGEIYPINLCIPFYVMEPLISGLNEQNWMTLSGYKWNDEHKKKIGEIIKTSLVPIIAELGKTDITINDFLSLEEGDVIMLNQRANQGLNIQVGNCDRFLGKPGVVGKKKAIQILKVFDKEN